MARPTKYKKTYCKQIIAFMENGYSVTAFAGSIGVARSSVYLWADEYPEFSDALKIAQAKAAIWWEDRLRAVAQGGEGSAVAAIFGLKNRVADDWREKQEVDHQSSDGSMTPAKIIIEAVDDNCDG
ncbi:hypothetical protein AB1K62_14415 [Parasphingorhabdus sp. JC815]|uniref:hypothetical protein n=1 Tax=Parasphingorhabdus sp. JC815 TaxID=3232140 RepID=UPI003457CFE2